MDKSHIIKFKTNGIPLFEISSNPLVYEILQYIKNIEENDNIITPLLQKFNETINNNTELQFPKLLTNGRSTEGLIKFAVGIYNGNTIDIQPHPIEVVEHDTKGTNYLPYLSVDIENDKIKKIIYKTLQYIIDSNYFDTKLKKGEYIRFVIELYHNRKINDIPNFHRDLQGEYESLMLFLCYENYSDSNSDNDSDSDLFGDKQSDNDSNSDLFGDKQSDNDSNSDLFGGKNNIQKGGDVLSAEFNLSCNEENNNSFRFLLKYPYNTIYSQNLVHSTAFANIPKNFTPRSIMRRLPKNEAELLLHGSSRNFVRIVATKHNNDSSKISHDARIIKKKICFKQKQKTIKYKNKKSKKSKKNKKIKRKLKNFCSMNSDNLTININNLNDPNITSFINDCISNNISDVVQLKG